MSIGDWLKIFNNEEAKIEYEKAKIEAEKAIKKREKERKERFKEYEPYDLSEIKNIILKAKKKTEKETIEHKLTAYGIALNKINLIIDNFKSVRGILEEEGNIDDPRDYYDELDKANISKNNFEIEIADLTLEAAKQTKPNGKDDNAVTITKLRTDNLPEGDSPASKPETAEEQLTTRQAAEYLKMHPSTLYHKSDEDIPRLKIGREIRYEKNILIAWAKAGAPKNFLADKVKGNSVNLEEKAKKTSHFLFTIPLEPLTNVLAENDKYLDKENAALMVDRFSKEPKLPMGRKIKWKKDANSLLTFIYLSDRLEYIDKSISSNFSEHITTTDTDKAGIKEEYEEGKEVLYQEFVVENFEIEEGGKSGGTLSREWRKINTAILGLYSQVAKGNKENLTTRAKTIKYYFKNKEKEFRLNRNKEEYIDKEILEIMCQFYSAK